MGDMLIQGARLSNLSFGGVADVTEDSVANANIESVDILNPFDIMGTTSGYTPEKKVDKSESKMQLETRIVEPVVE